MILTRSDKTPVEITSTKMELTAPHDAEIDRLRGEIIPDRENCLFVKCGDVVARLHLSLFSCPGIHVNCIEMPDGQFVSPRQLVILSGRSKHKDWKGSITIHRKTIRSLMDMGIIKFANHEQRCTKKCTPHKKKYSDVMWEIQMASHPVYSVAMTDMQQNWQARAALMFQDQGSAPVIASTKETASAPYVILSTTPVNADKLPQAKIRDPDLMAIKPVGRKLYKTVVEHQERSDTVEEQRNETSEIDAIWNQLKTSSREVLMAVAGRVIGDIVNDQELDRLAQLVAKYPELVQKAQALLDSESQEEENVRKRKGIVELDSTAKKACSAAVKAILDDLETSL